MFFSISNTENQEEQLCIIEHGISSSISVVSKKSYKQDDILVSSNNILKFTLGQRQRLKSLVADCNIYALTEKQSLQYIHRRFGQEISSSYFYSIKKSLQSDTEVQAWLNDFCKVGFVLQHRKRLEELQLVQRILFDMLFAEREKENSGDGNDASTTILSIMDRITQVSKRLQALQNATPI